MAFVKEPLRPSERRKLDLVRNSNYSVPLVTKPSSFPNILVSESGLKLLMTTLLILVLCGALTFGFVGLLRYKGDKIPDWLAPVVLQAK